jgi:hypothetical protein
VTYPWSHRAMSDGFPVAENENCIGSCVKDQGKRALQSSLSPDWAQKEQKIRQKLIFSVASGG